MWGKPGNEYDAKNVAKFGSSHKWHLVDPDSIEYRDVHVARWKTPSIIVSKPFGMYMCGGKKVTWIGYNDRDLRHLLILKDSVNLNGSGICAYCKNFRLKELGLKEKVMG